MLHFLDFEVLKHDWLVVIANPITQTETVIVNDTEQLKRYYDQFKSEIFVGYNIREYDQWIFKGILAGFDPYEINDHIIHKKRKGHEFSSVLRDYPLIIYDVEQLNRSLKLLEAMQGHSIYESEISFNIDRKLTPEEMEETIHYCQNDVQETMDLFTQLKADFDVQMELINEFKLPLSCISLTQTQLTAEILGAERRKCKDEFDLNFPPYLDHIKKYRYIVDWFKQFKTDRQFDDDEKKKIYSQRLDATVAGCPHTFAWGGLHGALPKYYGTGYYLHIDVSQYYPSLTVKRDYFSRATSEEGKKRYDMMRLESIRLKQFPELKKKRAGYKLCNNKAYGGMKDKYNKLYDPLMANNICVTGQLSLLLLIEMLEDYVQLIQSNTDGLIVRLESLDLYEQVDDICWTWEQMTGVTLAFDPIITRIYQKDVNNYLFVDEFNKVEAKGAYVKELSRLDYDLPIVNRAVRDYMINGTTPEVTVNAATDLIDFQRIVKLTGNYDYMRHMGRVYGNKCYRLFAVTDGYGGTLYKCKMVSGAPDKVEKVANTPERCIIYNGDMSKQCMIDYLDREWYINMAYERLRQFGVSNARVI